MVCMYSVKLCGKCKMYKRELNELNIRFREVDITNDKEKRDFVKSLGFSKMPVFSFNAKFFDDLDDLLDEIQNQTN